MPRTKIVQNVHRTAQTHSINWRQAKAAEIYPPRLCKAIIEGLIAQMEEDGRITKGSVGSIMAVDP